MAKETYNQTIRALDAAVDSLEAPKERIDFVIGCFIGLAIGFGISWLFGI